MLMIIDIWNGKQRTQVTKPGKISDDTLENIIAVLMVFIFGLSAAALWPI